MNLIYLLDPEISKPRLKDILALDSNERNAYNALAQAIWAGFLLVSASMVMTC